MLRHSRNWISLTLLLFLAAAPAFAHKKESVAELKARISDAKVSDKVKICLKIAEMQLEAADKQYTAMDLQNANTSLTDVVTYAELARDYSIQSHKHQKKTEIATRNMTRKLTDILHGLASEYQAPVKDALARLQHVRDDLLASMFPKGAK